MCERAGRLKPDPKNQIAVLDEDSPSHTSRDYSFDYLSHCAWAARKLAARKPASHIDFGSYTYFSAICSAFLPSVTFCDIREFGVIIPGLATQKADLTQLPFADSSVRSASCLHVLEHLGLARYGDQLDVDGDLKGAKELMRILAPGGVLLMVLPMNREPRIQFNAHRIYCRMDVGQLFHGMRFSEQYILDDLGREVLGDEPHGNYTGCFQLEKM